MMRLRRKRLTLACVAACGCLGIALLGVSLTSTSPSRVTVARSSSAALSSALQRAGLRPGTQFTPVTASTLTVPEPVAGSDGRIHLAYELLLLNVTAVPVRISQVEVQDATTHQSLLDLTGAALTAAFTPVGGPAGDESTDDPAAGSPPATIPSSATWVVWLDVSLPAGQAVPRHLEHRVTGTIILPGGVSPVPFDDVIKITSYFSYRQPVIAAAPGTVVDSQDGLPNSTTLPDPPKPPPIDQTVGNHVTVRIGAGLYVLYAHLDPGSVQVHIGEKVSRGQLLGLIGTSGNSTTPHLHFQIMTTPEFFPTDSVPYVFDQFRLLGRVPDRIWDDNLGLQPTGTLPFVPAQPSGLHYDQLPLDRTVVRFPQPGSV